MRATGLLLVLLSAATFATSGPFADSLLVTGWSPGAAVTTRICTAAAVLTLPALLAARGRWPAIRAEARLLAVYGLLAVAGCQLMFFYAVQHLSVGVALLLEYSGSVLVVAWLWLHDHQRPGAKTALGAALCTAGLVLVLDVVHGAHVDLVGVLFGLGAAVGLATFYVLSSRAETDVPPLVNAWIGMIVGGVALLVAGAAQLIPMQVATSDVRLADTNVSWFVPVLGISLVAAVIAYTAGIAGARRVGSRIAAFVGLSEVLFAVVFAYLLVDQSVSGTQILGGAVVVGGIALVRADTEEDAA